MEKICDAYKCKPIEGMLSHQLKQFKIDGEKTIIQNPNDAQKKEHEKYTLETHEVWHLRLTRDIHKRWSLKLLRNNLAGFYRVLFPW